MSSIDSAIGSATGIMASGVPLMAGFTTIGFVSQFGREAQDIAAGRRVQPQAHRRISRQVQRQQQRGRKVYRVPSDIFYELL